ncbi:LysR substrate-binding domain-containing protein [Tardiphaga sp. P9-11]|uniref:LysR family transcriptional regulator n=1 Tax=Tardiphaga sp. P9-11 TaxID=2024614 RepID=UPI0011F216CF|nr:LysR substrate-binding domain-containing protein [Tardiphaga sp. P9-11]KAA0078537.1 LysR family transcriptional regulator [Tardiphaga sp. P9-11]
MLDLQQLRYFVAVAETENVGRAATQLHISQSPLSRQMQQLEARLGLALFAREKKRLRLTTAGRTFLKEARALLAHAAKVENGAQDIAQGRAGSLAIGYVEGAIHSGVIAAGLRALRDRAPNVRLQLRSLRSAPLFAAISQGDLDVGLAYSAPSADGVLVGHLCAEEKFLLAVPEGHPLATGRLLPQRLHGQTFIAAPESRSLQTRQAFLQACAVAGFMPNIQFEADNPTIALGFVEAGLGLAIVQASLRHRAAPSVVLRAMPGAFPLRMRIYAVAARDTSALVRVFLDACRRAP